MSAKPTGDGRPAASRPSCVEAKAPDGPAGSEQQLRAAASLGELHPDLADAFAVHLRHGPELSRPLDLVADHRLAADLAVHQLGQLLLGVLGVELEAVERGHRAERGVAFEAEVAEDAQVALR